MRRVSVGTYMSYSSSTLLSRRALLGAASAFLIAAVAAPARAEGSPVGSSRVVRVATDGLGVTITLELEHAPFPAPGGAYRDPTVLVFVPHHHRASRDGTVAMLVHFHGHSTTAERALARHELREQLTDSKQNAILVVPQLALLAPDSSCGKLEHQGGFARLLGDVLRTLDSPVVRAATKSASIPRDAAIGRVCLSAHSGGYHAAASVLKQGAIAVRETYLFDALYAETDVFRDWVIAGRGRAMTARHKLVSYYTAGTTATNTQRLFEELGRAGVDCASEQVEGTLSREQLTHAEAIAIKTRLAHGAVTSELNGLRDCLYASALHRHIRSSWFDVKTGSRPLERRRP